MKAEQCHVGYEENIKQVLIHVLLILHLCQLLEAYKIPSLNLFITLQQVLL